MNLNQIQLIGNLGRDFEKKTFESGGTIANTSLAVSDNYKNKAGEWISQTNWVNLQLGGPYASETAGRFRKGQMVVVTGSLKVREYEKDGAKRSFTYVAVQSIKSLEKASENAPQATSTKKEPVVADDLPF